MAQDIAEKVALLLAQAEGTDNPVEAEAFTRKAEELMLKHGIDEAMIAARRPGTKADPIIRERIPFVSQYAAAVVHLGTAVSQAFNCQNFQTLVTDKGARATHSIWLVGHQSDVQQAATLVQSLLVQIEAALNYWWKNEGRLICADMGGSKKYAARREFCFAFCNGVRSRLNEVYNRVVEEAGTGAELVLRDRTKLVEDWVNKNMTLGGSRAGKTRSAGDYHASLAGHAAGREAVGTRKITT